MVRSGIELNGGSSVISEKSSMMSSGQDHHFKKRLNSLFNPDSRRNNLNNLIDLLDGNSSNRYALASGAASLNSSNQTLETNDVQILKSKVF